MAVKQIVLYPDKPLTQKAEPVTKIGPQIERLAAEMIQAMEDLDGVGLAAPQIGVARRVIVVRNPETEQAMCLLNPQIMEAEGEEYGEEGCLSLPHVFAMVPRATRIVVKALNEHGTPMEFEATALLARIIQHEVDHLDGIVFLDRLDVVTREAKLREWQEIRQQTISAASNQ